MKNIITSLCTASAVSAIPGTLTAGSDKTLVCWVTLANTTQQGGSALTIQQGDKFDGIVFGEKQTGKWMAGSEMYARTQADQQANPGEKADDKTLVQMAVAYQGNQISIYRNGEPYASYEANNIDLLGAKDNIAVFGLRHQGTASGNKWLLLCISHGLGCRYYLGDFKGEKYLPEFQAMMSWNGNNYFAPESVLAKDGRRVMWAWLLNLPVAPCGIQSLPRELELPGDGVLRIRPLRELETLRYDKKQEDGITVKSDAVQRLKEISGNTLELEVVIKSPAAKEFGLDVLCDKNGENGVRVAYIPESKTLRVGTVNAPFALKEGEDLTLRVFIDKNLVEVFANDRQAAVSAAKFVPENLTVSLFSKGGDVAAEKVTSWKMKSIYAGE